MSSSVVIPKRLIVHSDEEIERRRAQEAALKAAERKARSQQSKFIQSFGPHLTGEQASKFDILARCFQIREASGNARAAYDGVGIPDSFGPKDVGGLVIDAGTYIQACERAIISNVHMRYVGAWRLISNAVRGDMDAMRAGQHYARDILKTTSSKGRDQSPDRRKAIRVVKACGEAIEKIEYKKKFAD